MVSRSIFNLLYISVFVIILTHLYIKYLLQEPIFRKSTEGSWIQGILNRIFGTNNNNSDDSIPFNNGGGGEMPSHPERAGLLDYIKTNLHSFGVERNRLDRVKASNFYNKWHDSDMHPEETDISKYFEIEQSVPDTKEILREITCDDKLKACKTPIKPLIDNQTGNPLFLDRGSDGTYTYLPDSWHYKDEKPMNGGRVDGIRAADEMASNFSTYAPASNTNDPKYQSSYPYIQSAGQW